MTTINKVMLLGHLGRDPETRYTHQGTAVCTLALATSQKWRDKATGEKREKTEWSRVILYERKAEIAKEYLKKGSRIYIEGRLETEKWTDKDGIVRYTTKVIADLLQMMGEKQESTVHGPSSGQATDTATQQSNTSNTASAQAAPVSDFDDDIPF